jgi:hypothetical protein
MRGSATATQAASGMRGTEEEKSLQPSSRRNGLICSLVVAACVLVADPRADMPFSDGFSYVKTTLDFIRTGHILYNGWATAMLGWLVPWGALFIKVFGFSFTVMRLSMLPIDIATVFLFHQILRRFGLNSQNAIFGTFAFALSPIFFPSAASYMTDVPGMLVIFICLYMCIRAVATTNNTHALLWLCFAAGINVLGGTVRQIAWLGALVIVPSTAWLLRERRDMKIAGGLLWIFSLAGVLACLHWFNSQPYSVPEHIIWALPTLRLPFHLAAQIIKTFLCLFLVLFPVLTVWLPSSARLGRKAWLRITGVAGLWIVFWIVAYRHTRLDTWLMPWLEYLLVEQSSLAPHMFGTPVAAILWIRIAISLLVIVTGLIVMELAVALCRESKPTGGHGSALPWNETLWLLVPFSLAYFLLLLPRGAFDQIQDRYLVGLTPVAIVFLVRLYQDRVSSKLPPISFAVLAFFAIYSVAGTHDMFVEARAQVRIIQMLESSGIPRKSIQAGFPADGWLQIQDGGHMNESRIRVPADAYNPNISTLIPDGCRNGFTKFTPIIVPKYFVIFPWMKNPSESESPKAWCFVPAEFPSIDYTTWLPPFHAVLPVEKLSNRSY